MFDGGAVRLDGPVTDRDERARVQAIVKREKPAERVGVDRAQAQRGCDPAYPHRVRREEPVGEADLTGCSR